MERLLIFVALAYFRKCKKETHYDSVYVENVHILLASVVPFPDLDAA